MTEPSAKIILDSISPEGTRLTTMEIVCHRFVLAEFNTHRAFSRNSASSRAIPVRKQLERVMEDPAIPLVWPQEQSGMQGGDEVTDEEKERFQRIWLEARDSAVHYVSALTNAFRKPENYLIHPLHKSVANRLLEPFMWHTIIVSSTEWDNFFGLRCNPLAQPEIQAVAYAMRDAYEWSVPQELDYGQWHTPYIQPDDVFYTKDKWYTQKEICKVSAARCARVSYLTQDGVRDMVKDIELCDRLCSADPMHASPLEHVATPCVTNYHSAHQGNFIGWDQFRHEVTE